MTPTIGRIVHYTLNDQDAQAINRRRDDFETHRPRAGVSQVPGQFGATGHQAHVGNRAVAGQVFPAMIVRTFGGDTVNLQVFLDGNDTYWATSRTVGEGEFHWTWPPRV